MLNNTIMDKTKFLFSWNVWQSGRQWAYIYKRKKEEEEGSQFQIKLNTVKETDHVTLITADGEGDGPEIWGLQKKKKERENGKARPGRGQSCIGGTERPVGIENGGRGRTMNRMATRIRPRRSLQALARNLNLILSQNVVGSGVGEVAQVFGWNARFSSWHGFLTSVSWPCSSDSSSIWILATWVGDLNWVPSSWIVVYWLWAGPVFAVGDI